MDIALPANQDFSTILLLSKYANQCYLSLFLLDSKSEETASSTTPSLSPKTEPVIPSVVESSSDDVENNGGEEIEELDTDEAVFSGEDSDQEKETSLKSKFKPIEREDEDATKPEDTIRGVDVVELEEFQNIDNTLLRDNILKLKNER